ncbi:OmpA family protein [Sulfitobacter sp. SK012]|uniref:OmpA family protein n=1 Tax=Sulfitobacter sp. SK012 TaxID=1389005 RepID=UPI000E0AE2E3|nr:OmpA family protein [Sulfitobacter sp. SK012]AXI45594.1 OmpA family protein [Sulfitobacter sp. SK012]
MSSLTIRGFWAVLLVLLLPIAGQASEIGTVNFKFDSDQLDAQGQAQVAEIAQRLKSVSSYKPTVVVGYTDAVGSSSYNQSLGQRRADTVAKELSSAGVPIDRIGTVKSRGKSDLLIKVASAERQNRRVTVELSDILAACQSFRAVPLAQSAIGDELQQDLLNRLSEAVISYDRFNGNGANGSAFQMAGAARQDCGQAVGYGADSVRKLEYAKKCFCNSARLQTALGNTP